VIAGELEPDPAYLIVRPQPGQDCLGPGRAQLPAHPAGGQLGQQPVQPAHRLGAQLPELFAAIAQQPQAHQRIIRGDLGDVGAVQGGQPDRDGVVPVGLAAMALGVHAHPGGQLRWHVQHQLAVGHQPLRQGPARPAAALHRPAKPVSRP
jgi:hypothetical protein